MLSGMICGILWTSCISGFLLFSFTEGEEREHSVKKPKENSRVAQELQERFRDRGLEGAQEELSLT